MGNVKKFQDFIKLNEISSDLFKSAINVSNERGTFKRTQNLGKIYFDSFIGKSLLDGTISNITINTADEKRGKHIQFPPPSINFDGSDYSETIVVIEINYMDSEYIQQYGENRTIIYDIDQDMFDLGNNDEIERRDAVVLSKIALQINPNSKYKETGRFFNIKY
jgi:hypothetical protein